MTETEDLVSWLLEDGYIAARVLPDGSIAAVRDLIYTRAIFMNCERYGYGARFCFDDRDLALQRFAELQSDDDVPAGFVARR